MVVAIPHSPLLYQPFSHFSSNYFIGQDGRLVVTFMVAWKVTRITTFNICRVIDERFKTFGQPDVCGHYSSCNYVRG